MRHGQILLVGDAILVLSETGELTLVEVNPKQFNELATIQALDPKTSPGTPWPSRPRISWYVTPTRQPAIDCRWTKPPRRARFPSSPAAVEQAPLR